MDRKGDAYSPHTHPESEPETSGLDEPELDELEELEVPEELVQLGSSSLAGAAEGDPPEVAGSSAIIP